MILVDDNYAIKVDRQVNSWIVGRKAKKKNGDEYFRKERYCDTLGEAFYVCADYQLRKELKDVDVNFLQAIKLEQEIINRMMDNIEEIEDRRIGNQ